MDDLKHRMKEWWEYDPGHIIPQALARIEALEAQVRAADALAEFLQSASACDICKLEAATALAAYRAAKEGGA